MTRSVTEILAEAWMGAYEPFYEAFADWYWEYLMYYANNGNGD